MKENVSWFLRVVYGLLIIIICLALFVVSSLSVWRNRNDSSAVILFALSAVFFCGVAVLLFAQGVTRWRYRSLARQMTFFPFGWKASTTDELLELVMEGRREATIGDNYHGKIDGIHLYVFNYSRGPAWWNKTWTIAASRLNRSVSENLAQAIEQRTEADVRFDSGWLIIRSRHRVPAKDLEPWLSSIADILNDINL